MHNEEIRRTGQDFSLDKRRQVWNREVGLGATGMERVAEFVFVDEITQR